LIRVLSVASELELRDFSAHLDTLDIRHRITEEAGSQVLWVYSLSEKDRVVTETSIWGLKERKLRLKSFQWRRWLSFDWVRRFFSLILDLTWRAPFSCLLVFISVVVFLLSGMGQDLRNVTWLFFPEIELQSVFDPSWLLRNPVIFLNLISPIFLHFTLIHITFNMLWLLFLGAQLENSCLPNGSFLHGKALSLFCFLITVLITGLVGNITQYIVGGGPNFGGMSGVIYGLMGYTWLMGKGFPYSGIGFPNSTFGAMLLLLVVMEIFAGSWIASGAHLGGLVTGLSCAGILITIYRIRN